MELEWVKVSERWGPHHWELDINPIDITYSSSLEDYEHRGVKGRSHLSDILRDLKIETPKFDDNLKPKNYLDWAQTIERIFKIKEYNDEKAFM